MATIHIDGKSYEVDEKKNLLEVILSLGYNLPYFCWHPAMGSVGACRQCAIKSFKDENDKKGKIIMSCMEQVQDGMRLSIEDPEAVEMRSNVIQWLMTNHPHDCPICDEGGECHLQDMTNMTGHVYRKFRFNKRTYRNQYLGPFINHEMNRCIQCYRCVRFYRDYAGGRDLQELASKNRVYFGRQEEGVLQNEFSGNLVEICPTGVFTDKTLKKHYTRKWDLQTAPSICHLCSLGCNTIAGERYGSIRRILSRYNGEVNGYFICDRGRFGYEFTNSRERIKAPRQQMAGNSQTDSVDKEQVLNNIARLIKDKKILGIGSPSASLESNFMLKKMAGEEFFSCGMSARDKKLVDTARQILSGGPARNPSLKEIEKADVVLILGEDVTNTAPMTALALRQAAKNQPKKIIRKMQFQEWHDAAVREATQQEKGPFYCATPAATKLDEIATRTYHAAPDDIARLGFAVAHAIDGTAAAPEKLPEDVQKLAGEIAGQLKNAERPLVVSGTGLRSEAILHSAANVAWALSGAGKPADLFLTVPEANSMGMSLLDGLALEEVADIVQKEKIETAVILENDIYERVAPQIADQLFDNCKHVICLDYLKLRTNEKAEFVLPAGSFAEANGTLVNNEGRAQRFYQVYIPTADIQESWAWLQAVGLLAGQPYVQDLKVLDDITRLLVKEYPQFDGAQDIAPPAGYRVDGQKIPRQPHRYSGRTAMRANVNVSEPKPPEDPDTPFSYTMEGYRGQPPAALIPRFWWPAWNSVQSINKFQIEIGGPLHGGDPGKRLIEPSGKEKKPYFKEIPKPFEGRKNQWFVFPLYHIFGSENLSRYTPGVEELAPKPYLALNSGDAEKLKLEAGNKIAIQYGDTKLELPVKPGREIPAGCAGLPRLPGLSKFETAEWAKMAGGTE